LDKKHKVMLQSVMVYQNNNDFFHMQPSMLDDNMTKLINSDQVENYIASASTSPVQGYVMAPSFPQQQHQNQRQHQLQQYPVSSIVSHSAPSSPPYAIIKTEEIPQQPNMDYLQLFPNTFDLSSPSSSSVQQDQHILPSQRSQTMHYADTTLFQQQRQRHQRQQQKHHEQLRMQQLQQQMLYETSHSTTTSMAIPATSSMMSSIISADTSSSSLFAPSAITTSSPFFNPSTLAHDDSFSRQNTYTPSAHPAAPKRKLERQPSPQHSVDAAAAVVNSSAISSEDATAFVTMKKTSAATANLAGRPSTSSRLDKVKTTRSTKVTKSSTLSSSPSFNPDMIESETKAHSPKKIAKKIADSRESSEQPETNATITTTTSATNETTTRAPSHTGNVTHPRRAAQNRAAQRTFRNRRKAYIKELEQKVNEIDRTREMMEAIHLENQEVRRRLQIIESFASQNGLSMPTFPPLVPFSITSNEFAVNVTDMTGNGNGNISSSSSNGIMIMNNNNNNLMGGMMLS
ncbi:hypothetical protein BX616_004968, partial [Lobosporangium transversale]